MLKRPRGATKAPRTPLSRLTRSSGLYSCSADALTRSALAQASLGGEPNHRQSRKQMRAQHQCLWEQRRCRLTGAVWLPALKPYRRPACTSLCNLSGQPRVNRNGWATRERSSESERDCLAQKKPGGRVEPTSTQEKKLNGHHKRCGESEETIQALVQIGERRKRRWPDGQAKKGRKQGETRLQTLK